MVTLSPYKFLDIHPRLSALTQPLTMADLMQIKNSTRQDILDKNIERLKNLGAGAGQDPDEILATLEFRRRDAHAFSQNADLIPSRINNLINRAKKSVTNYPGARF